MPDVRVNRHVDMRFVGFGWNNRRCYHRGPNPRGGSLQYNDVLLGPCSICGARCKECRSARVALERFPPWPSPVQERLGTLFRHRDHEQFIMAYLLQHEGTSFLETRGPFNAVFGRRSEDGFSIDKPLSLWTLLLSGLIIIEGRSTTGPELICLDLRRGTPFTSVPFGTELRDFREDQKADKDGGVLSCELPRERTLSSGGGNPQARLVRGREGNMERFKASGIYGNADIQFV